MIPIKDYNPTRHFPYVTVALLVVNIGVYFLVQRPGSTDQIAELRFTYRYAAIPCEVVEGRPLTAPEINATLRGDDSACGRSGDMAGSRPVFGAKNVYLAVVLSMFLHGSLLHIGGNMLFLWVFGNNIEDRMGSVPYLGFYLAAGLVASLAHVLAGPSSTVPVVGASGAIAGVMGSYLVLFPDVRIRSIFAVFFFFPIDLPAKWLLGYWLVSQFFVSPTSGVAWVAHVGGFAFGAAVAWLLRDRLRPSRVSPVPPGPYGGGPYGGGPYGGDPYGGGPRPPGPPGWRPSAP